MPSWRPRSTATRRCRSARANCFGGASQRGALPIPATTPWLPAERLQREFDAVGFFLSGHPLDDYAPLLKGLRVQSWVEFSRAVKAGATAGRVAATVVSRTERRTKTGNKMGIFGLSDPSGQYEAILFAEGLGAVPRCAGARKRGPAISCPRKRRATMSAPASRPPSRSIRRPRNSRRACGSYLRDAGPLEAVSKRLDPIPSGNGKPQSGRSDGEVNVVLMMSDGGEVEIRLPGRFKVSPQIAGAIKAVPGVVQVEAV